MVKIYLSLDEKVVPVRGTTVNPKGKNITVINKSYSL